MNDSLDNCSEFSIVYICNVLIYSKNLDQHFNHLKYSSMLLKGKVSCFCLKIKIFSNQNSILGHEIFNGTIKPIQRSIKLAVKFPGEIQDKNQLQRFFGCSIILHIVSRNIEKLANHYFKGFRKPSYMVTRAYSNSQVR